MHLLHGENCALCRTDALQGKELTVLCMELMLLLQGGTFALTVVAYCMPVAMRLETESRSLLLGDV
jgi:hypothetical protein